MGPGTMDDVVAFAREGRFSSIDVTGGATELLPGLDGFIESTNWSPVPARSKPSASNRDRYSESSSAVAGRAAAGASEVVAMWSTRASSSSTISAALSTSFAPCLISW